MQARLTHIDRGQVLVYLGWRGGAVEPQLETDIGRCVRLLMDTARPRAVWRVFGLGPGGAFDGTSFVPAGRDIRAHLDGYPRAAAMAATLGAETDTLLRRVQARSMADAVILDACASAAIENVCDNLCDDIGAELAPMHLTDRFSPGYGDMPLAQQGALCRLLDAERRIGLTLTDAGLMLPQKSVTALIGVSPVPVEKRPRGCAVCPGRETCQYRKDGMTCGSI